MTKEKLDVNQLYAKGKDLLAKGEIGQGRAYLHVAADKSQHGPSQYALAKSFMHDKPIIPEREKWVGHYLALAIENRAVQFIFDDFSVTELASLNNNMVWGYICRFASFDGYLVKALKEVAN